MSDLSNENPYTSLFWDMLAQAKAADASDLHIQPEKNGVDLRFRIHGELVRWKWIPEVHRTLFLQEVKRLCGCSLAISGRAQDGRITVPYMGLDVRVNLIPSLYGEKLVLRLLDQSRLFNLNSSGLDESATRAIERALSQKTGVSLLTGPTGSGKTTLLYSALNQLDRNRLNVVSIEDPIEYTFTGVTQIQASAKLGFSDALRAILRQDPDVILLGELRDEETAKLCFQAASTGHLVLSTLHANSASEVTDRLEGFGLNPELIGSCMRFSSAQRLMPKLCPECKLPLSSDDLRRGMRLIGPVAALRKRNREGCGQCNQGVVGRIPIFEYIEWRQRSAKANDQNFQSPSLCDAALELARKGEVDAFEALAAG